MKSISAITLFLGISAAAVILQCFAEESPEISKRYLAALAKNGRLPKFANAQKKDQPQEESLQSSEKEEDEEYSRDMLHEDKRHVGAFLKSHGRPIFTRSFTSSIHHDDDSNQEGKRNIASMARLGKLNAMRFANVHGKRVDSVEKSNNDEENSLKLFEDPDCFETESPSDNENRPIWMQKKRYVAALARSGRLPIWHSQRMWWGGKRDDSRPYNTRSEEGNRDENAINDIVYGYPKNKRCKKMYDYQMGKRNVAALARNGKLPFRSSA